MEARNLKPAYWQDHAFLACCCWQSLVFLVYNCGTPPLPLWSYGSLACVFSSYKDGSHAGLMVHAGMTSSSILITSANTLFPEKFTDTRDQDLNIPSQGHNSTHNNRISKSLVYYLSHHCLISSVFPLLLKGNISVCKL